MAPPNGVRLLLVGDVFVDYHLRSKLVRLGGIMHAARALDSVAKIYSLCYIAPSYLSRAISRFSRELNAEKATCIGETNGSPNVMMIGDSEEAGPQGYEDLLREERQVVFDLKSLGEELKRFNPTDILLFPSKEMPANLFNCLQESPARLHIDVQYEASLVLEKLRKPAETIFCSTSSPLFLDKAAASPEILKNILIPQFANVVVLKENRGGSRAVANGASTWAEAPTYPTETKHSVGVGDCFNAIWIVQVRESDFQLKLKYSSFIASSYAATFDHSEFKADVAAIAAQASQAMQLGGVRVPWERRNGVHIYIAAPDFPGKPIHILDELEAALKYHNFCPHRPIKENGLYQTGIASDEAEELYWQDIKLLDRCQILIAVPLTSDPGTFVELGMSKQAGKKTILYDPFNRVDNLFAMKTPDHICKSLSEAIESVFWAASEVLETSR